MTGSDETFDRIKSAFQNDIDVSIGKMFGSEGLKVKNKVFALKVRDNIVFKLPANDVAYLVEKGVGKQFDPGHGKLMREWVELLAHEPNISVELANKAYRYVKSKLR